MRRIGSIAGLGLALLLAACDGDGERPGRTSGSALRVDPLLGSLSGSEMSELKGHGVDELFLEAVRVDPGGALEPAPGLEHLQLPPGTEATLVVRGGLPSEPTAFAKLFAEVRWTVENQGVVARGVHLDVPSPSDPKDAAKRVERLREVLPPETPISARLEPSDLDRKGIEEWARAPDFLSVRLYGVPPGEDESPGAWSFEAVRSGAERIEALGLPWMLEAIVTGKVLRLDSRNRIVDQTTEASPTEIFWNRSLELRAGFTLTGSDRRTYTLEAKRATEVAGWSLVAGEAVRVLRPATSDLEGLLRLLDAMVLEHHLGQIYSRLPAPSEGLSLSVDNLVQALEKAPATPDLHARAAVQRRAPDGWRFRFSLENRNEEITELSLIDNNYLEIRLEHGSFGAVAAGDFFRYDLFRSRGDALDRTFRNADVLRLHLALLAGRQGVHTGEVEIRGVDRPVVHLGGRFLLPDGRTVQVEPAIWSDGELSEPAVETATDRTEGAEEGPEG